MYHIVQYKQYTCLTCSLRSSHVTIMWASCDHYSFLHCRSSPTQQARRALPAVFHKVKNITKRYLTYSQYMPVCDSCTCTLLTNVYMKVWAGYSDMIEVSSHCPKWFTILRRFSSLFLFIYWLRYCRYAACGRKAEWRYLRKVESILVLRDIQWTYVLYGGSSGFTCRLFEVWICASQFVN